MSGTLVFRATITAIECAPLRGLDWVIRTRVLEVVGGTFEQETFAFRVHSPSRAGLEVGITCTVTAEWTGDGYRVDENQWRGSAAE